MNLAVALGTQIHHASTLHEANCHRPCPLGRLGLAVLVLVLVVVLVVVRVVVRVVVLVVALTRLMLLMVVPCWCKHVQALLHQLL